MNIEEIKNYLSENKDSEEVQALLKEFNSVEVTLDDVKGFLEKNEEGKKFLGSEKDKFFTSSLETWKSNNLKKLVDEELKKHNPDETPEQKRIRELEEYVQQKESEALFQTNKNIALNYLNEKKLPSTLVDYFVGNDENSTMENLNKFEEVFTNQLQTAVESRLKKDGTDLEGTSSKNKTFTLEQIQAMSQEEVNENWEAVQEAIKNNN